MLLQFSILPFTYHAKFGKTETRQFSCNPAKISITMTLEALFLNILEYRVPIILLVLVAPWLTYLLCFFIPGKLEEPFLLSLNLGLAVLSLFLWVGYLAYATNTGGWQRIVQQADIFLLFLPPYYLSTSLWISQQRLPLDAIPAFRIFKGLMLMAGVFLVLSWLLGRIRLIFFSYLPFSAFLWFLAILLAIAYTGYQYIVRR